MLKYLIWGTGDTWKYLLKERRSGDSRIVTMQQNQPLSLSDFIRDPDAVIEDFNNISEDDDIEYVKEYGNGIDCHSKFIEVCIRYRNRKGIQKALGHFSTNWDDLVAARDWCIQVLNTKAEPVPKTTPLPCGIDCELPHAHMYGLGRQSHGP